MKRSPIKRKPSKKSEIPQEVRDVVRDRSRGICEVGILCGDQVANDACGSFYPHDAHHMHHVLRRSRGGEHDPETLIHVCHLAHGWIHANPAKSYELGLLRKGTQ